MKTKTKLLAALAVALTLHHAAPLNAQEDNSIEVLGDVFVARPGGAVATVIGSALFVVSLPFTAPTGKARKAAEVLVRRPAWWTCQRPLGKF